jgi:glycosyltransferase involved in cell wall biosynthesis
MDHERFFPAEAKRPALRARWGMDGPAFVTVRNLVARTGVDLLVDAFARVRASRPDAGLWIGGTGAMADAIAARVRELGLREAVRLLGFVPDEDLADLYRAADCFVLPTRFLEGFGLVTLEALGCGTPVVATPVGANPETVGDWRRDAVVAAVDAASLAAGMTGMLDALAADAAGIRRSCAAYAGGFRWARHAERLEEVLAEIGAP